MRREAEGRADDDAATFLRRMDEYRAQTTDLIPHYRGLGLLVDVDAVGSVDEVTRARAGACKAGWHRDDHSQELGASWRSWREAGKVVADLHQACARQCAPA